MAYIVELRKEGRLRGELFRASEKEAQETVSEWESRCAANSACYYKADPLKFAVYSGGKLKKIVGPEELVKLKENSDEHVEWAIIHSGTIYENFVEAVHADLVRYGVMMC